MTLEEFVKKYNKKKVDYDGVYGAQCVDLFRQYCPDVLKIKEHTGPCASSGGAKDLFLDYDKMPVEKKYFIRSNKKTFIPGDVIIWNETEKNKYGHIAIFLGYLGKDTLIVFEQNGFSQEGCEIVLRDKTNILGYLRKRG